MIQNRLLLNFKHFPKVPTCKYVQYRPGTSKVDITGSLQEVAMRDFNSIEDWKQVKEDVLKISNRFTPVNVDTALLSSYITNEKFDVALKYIQFLKNEQDKLSLAVLGKLFKVYHKLYAQNGLPDDKEKEIIGLIDEMKSKYPHLDTFTNEAIITCLSLTKDWEKCMSYLDEIKILSNPTHACYNSIIIAAFKNGHHETAWTLLEEMLTKGRTPSDDCFLQFLIKLEALPKTQKLENLERLFGFFHVNDFICGTAVAIKMQEVLSKDDATVKVSKISSRGLCNICKETIPAIELSDDEFNGLKKAFMERVIVGKDVFGKTTPDELNKFKAFIEKNKKYDVIIDGLNVAYSTGVNKNSLVFSRLVACVVRHYAAQNKSVLVLGRKHMTKWPPKYMKFIKNNSDLFLTQNISQDDPYLLYCALNSGMRTAIVTRDLMRSHIYLLKDAEHKKAFSRWLNQSLHRLITVLPNDKVLIQNPLPYVRTAQKLKSTWHVPYTTGSEQQHDDNWLCIQTNA